MKPGGPSRLIVVADTSPINYLLQIDQVDLLRQLYGEIIVPRAVLDELSHHAAPAAVIAWALRRPDWIKVCRASSQPAVELARLDEGEREAILLALELRADTLLIDELKGRTEARRRGLSMTGTLGILMLAGKQGLIDPLYSYRRLLSETSFHISTELEERFVHMVRVSD